MHRLLWSPVSRLGSGRRYSRRCISSGLASSQSARPPGGALGWGRKSEGHGEPEPRSLSLQVGLVGEGTGGWVGTAPSTACPGGVSNYRHALLGLEGSFRGHDPSPRGMPLAFRVVWASHQLAVHTPCLFGLPLIFLECAYPVLWTALLEKV